MNVIGCRWRRCRGRFRLGRIVRLLIVSLADLVLGIGRPLSSFWGNPFTRDAPMPSAIQVRSWRLLADPIAVSPVGFKILVRER
jgi:hypothetical protein